MIQKFAAWLFFKVHRWKLIGELPKELRRCVYIFAPHTSNWDFYYGVLATYAWGLPAKYAIKDFWTKFPFGLIIKPLGGVGIDRSQGKDRKNQIQTLAAIFDNGAEGTLVITPEGSRSKRTKWKTGFYHIAKAANVPIVMFNADYQKRTVWFSEAISTDLSLDEVMYRATEFYETAVAMVPSQFTLDERYVKK